jgi:signal transduction histidine kinase
MTSHELRNPLSAVLQCADSVITTLQQLPIQTPDATPTALKSNEIQEDIRSSIDALQTIVSCSLHSKRVLDDVLTLSKLDSDLIQITPVRVQPNVVISDALKLFMVECQQTDIQLDLIQDETIKEFEWVMLDPSRLLQILINLL